MCLDVYRGLMVAGMILVVITPEATNMRIGRSCMQSGMDGLLRTLSSLPDGIANLGRAQALGCPTTLQRGTCHGAKGRIKDRDSILLAEFFLREQW